MSRSDRLQRLGLRVMIALSVWCLGAVTVRAMVLGHARDAAAARARDQVQAWHWQIGEDMPAEQREVWREISRGNPERLLRACSLERVGGSEQE
jgi:hypothetical protein